MAHVPFVDTPPLYGLSVHSICLAAAVLLGHFLLVRRAAAAQRPIAAGFSAAVLFGAAFGGHWLYLFLRPELLVRHPIVLVIPTAGASTLGALFGAVIAGALYLRRHAAAAPALFNAAAWAFPFAWIFARLGCFLTHDQAALHYSGWLAVNYPGGPRHDLALYEILYAAILAAAFYAARHRPWPFAAILLCSYGALRAAIHPLRLTLHTVDIVGAWLVLAAGVVWLLYFSQRDQTS